MASSGQIFTARRNTSAFYLKWQVATQDIANNRTKVNWQAGLDIDGGYYWLSNAVKINSIHVAGGGSLGSGTWSNIYGPTQKQLKSGSKWIYHNSNGAKSFSADISGWLYGESNLSTSGSWSLPTIPRNSQVSTNAGSYDLGNDVTVKTNRKSSSFSHTIKIRENNSGGALIKQFNSVGSSVTWSPSAGEITQMQDAIPNSNQLTAYINQYNNQVGDDSDTTIKLNLKDADPTFTDFVYEDTDAATVAITGNDQVLVKGKSVLQVDVASANKMTAIKGASEDRYSFGFGGTSEQEDYHASNTVSGVFSTVPTIGDRTIQVAAFDSRNNATIVSKSVTVYDYAAPTITATLTRENNFGSDTTIALEGTYSRLTIGGTDKNSPQTGTLDYRYKEEYGSFGSWTNISFTDNADGTYDITDFVVSLDNTKKYFFEFRINDEFGTVTVERTVDVGVPIMFVGENSGSGAVGINKLPENGALDVDGDIYSSGNKVSTVSPVAFKATMSAAQSITNQTFTHVDYDTSEYDLGGDYSTANQEFTAPVDGLYYFNASISRDGGFVGDYRFILQINVNSTAALRVADKHYVGDETTFQVEGAGTIKLDADDVVDVDFWSGTGDTQDFGDTDAYRVFFSGHLAVEI